MLDILIAEDEDAIREGLAVQLRMEGFAVRMARTGTEALALYDARSPDLLLLDVRMPGMDGYEVCRRVRERDTETPVLFLTALDAQDDRVRGLRLGADDYMPKTLSAEERTLRIRGALRRAGRLARSEVFDFAGARVDPEAMCVRAPDGTMNKLSDRELVLLRQLVARRGELLTWDALQTRCWGSGSDGSDAMVKQALHRLREKLGSAAASVRTVWGMGVVYAPGDFRNETGEET